MKLQVKQGSKASKSSFDLSSQHITTADFGTIQPTYISEVVPGDSYKINLRVAARLSPLAVPTFGDIKVITRVFFVPMRSIFRGFDEWISRNNDSSLSPVFPTVTNKQIVDFFVRNVRTATDDGLVYVTLAGQSSDFTYGTGTMTSYTFTSKGRWLYKILLSLGYSINWSPDSTQFSALPILGFMRLVYDYIYPSQYVNNLGVGYLFDGRNFPDASQMLTHFLDLMYLPYQQDYFTAAWKDPNSVGPSTAQGFGYKEAFPVVNPSDVSGPYNASVNTDKDGVNFSHFDTNNDTLTTGNSSITAYGHRVLTAINDFITRNNLAGSRFFEQLFARFGIKSHKATPNRSIFLKSFVDRIPIIDVTALAGTERTELGELGAKGIMDGSIKHEVTFDASDESFGYIIALSHIEPETFYYQGRKRHTLHLDQFDFYTPELDNIGLQPIRNDELYADAMTTQAYTDGISYGGTPNGVFGFAPRYAEYKKRDDYLTGDFRIPSANSGLDSYHLARILPAPSKDNPLSLNSQFLGLKQFEFDRIFQNISDNTSLWGKIPFGNQDILTYQGLPLVGVNSTNKIFVAIEVRDDGFYQVEYSQAGYDNLKQSFGLAHHTMDVTHDTDRSVIKWTSADGAFVDPFSFTFNSVTGQSFTLDRYFGFGYILFSSNSVESRFYNYEELVTYFSNYFDHFVLYFDYNVNAHRHMLTISESMPIEEGSRELSVDAYGTHL